MMERWRYIYLPEMYFKAMWIFALFLYILIPLKSSAVSLAYQGIVFITFGCFILLFVKKMDKSKIFVGNKEMICAILLVITVIVSFLLGSEAITFDIQIIGILGFIEMPIAIMLMDCVDYSEQNKKFILYINILIAVVFSILSITKYAYSGILDSLYLGYSNPNATAIYILINQAILIMFLPMIKKINIKVLVIALCLYEEYLIYLTDSRTCLIISMAIVIYYFFGKNFKIKKCMILVAMIFPLVFLLVYTNMYAAGKYADLRILGKELYSGREVYFLSQKHLISWKNFLGDVRRYHFTNMHNGSLAIIASCGLLGYICWFSFYFLTIQRYYRNAKTQLQHIALVAILGVFFHSCSEAALIVGGAHYSIIVATFFWILKGSPYGSEVDRTEYK